MQDVNLSLNIYSRAAKNRSLILETESRDPPAPCIATTKTNRLLKGYVDPKDEATTGTLKGVLASNIIKGKRIRKLVTYIVNRLF